MHVNRINDALSARAPGRAQTSATLLLFFFFFVRGMQLRYFRHPRISHARPPPLFRSFIDKCAPRAPLHQRRRRRRVLFRSFSQAAAELLRSSLSLSLTHRSAAHILAAAPSNLLLAARGELLRRETRERGIPRGRPEIIFARRCNNNISSATSRRPAHSLMTHRPRRGG